MGSTVLASNQDLTRQLAWSRREFLCTGAAMALGSTLFPNPIALAGTPAKKRKVVVITVGGGARDQETFAAEGQENIPHVLRDLIPHATCFTQGVNRESLGLYVATARLATRLQETLNKRPPLPPAHPIA